MKLAIVLGTRPEIVKMSPILRECSKKGVSAFILHTGQHYTKELDEQIFSDLDLQKPKYNLDVGGKPYRLQVGWMTKEISKILMLEKPDAVIVQGDTISVLAGALAANKLGIPLAHHEAGLRSHDIKMIEETNRIIVDNISDFLFTPTPDALKNLHQEGIPPEKISFTGNTIVDAVLQNLKISEQKTNPLEKFNLRPKEYFLATSHRAENVDYPNILKGILNGLFLVGKHFNLPVLFVMHPRTKLRLSELGHEMPKEVVPVESLGFLEFLQLEKNAKAVITDSGGLQEECFILGTPCVTIRDSTERPETIEYGANMLAGTSEEKILESTKKMVAKDISNIKHGNPFGDGNAAERIISTLIRCLQDK